MDLFLSASGDEAIANGFTVSTSPTVVIGFSLTGSTISAGTGVLVSLDIEATEQPYVLQI